MRVVGTICISLLLLQNQMAFAANFSQAQKTYVPPSSYERPRDFALTGLQPTDLSNSSVASSAGSPANGAQGTAGNQPLLSMTGTEEKFPAPGEARLHAQIQELLRAGALDQAYKTAERAVHMYAHDDELTSDLVDVDLRRSKVYLDNHEFESAIKVVREALYYDPASQRASNELAALLRRAGYNPNDAQARLKMADGLVSQGRLAEAQVEYQAALRLAPLPQAYLGLGEMAMRSNEKPKAKYNFEKALEKEPNWAVAHRELGAYYNSVGDLVGASSELSRALSLDPKDQIAAHLLIDLWQRQVGRSPNDVNAHLGLAGAYQLAGDLKSAQVEYRQVVIMDPNNPNLPQARKSFKLAMNKQQATLAMEAAHNLELQGDVRDAVQKVDEGLSYDPGNINLIIYRGYLLEKVGQFPIARQTYMNALSIDPLNAYAAMRLKAIASLSVQSQLSPSGYPYLSQTTAPPPPPQMTQTGTISDLFWKIRSAAIDDRSAQIAKEDKADQLMKLYTSFKSMMANSGAPGGAAGGGLDLSALMGALGGGSGGSSHSDLGPPPPGLPPDLVMGSSSSHSFSSGTSAPSGMPPALMALLSGGPLPPQVESLIKSLGLRKPDGSLDLPKMLSLADTMGLKKPDGSIDFTKISAMLGGGALSTSAQAPAGAGAGLPPGIASIMSGNASSGAAGAGLPPGIASIMDGTASAQLAPTKKAAPAKKPQAKKASAKKTSAKKHATKASAKKGAKLAPKRPAAIENIERASEASTPAPQVKSALPATGGFNLQSFMPVINMAMQRFMSLENQTKAVSQQLQQTQEAVRELQQYVQKNVSGSTPLNMVPMAVPSSQAQPQAHSSSPLEAALNLPPNFGSPSSMPALGGPGLPPAAMPPLGGLPALPPTTMPAVPPSAMQAMPLPNLPASVMPQASTAQPQPIPAEPSLPLRGTMNTPGMPPVNHFLNPIAPPSVPLRGALDPLSNMTPMPTATDASQAQVPGTPTAEVGSSPSAQPSELHASMAPPLPPSAGQTSPVTVSTLTPAVAPPGASTGALPEDMPKFTDPGNISTVSPDSIDAASSSKSGKPAKQNKVRVEIEGVKPDILGIRLKFVVKNDENFAIPVPGNIESILKHVKVSVPANSVPSHGELHGSVKVPLIP